MDVPQFNETETKTATSQPPENKSVIDLKYILISFLAVLFVGIGAAGVWYLTGLKNTAPVPTARLPMIQPTESQTSSKSSSSRRSSSSSSAADISSPESVNLGNPDTDLQDLEKDLQNL